MKNLKKALALVVACLMLFGLVATAASPYPDVADDGTPLAEAVKVITALKIVEGDDTGNFNPNSSITRAEMAKILCTMVNTGSIGQSATIFDDTPSSHWASGYIATATSLGYIDGFGDGTFRPDEPVTYEQVVKLLACALGYRVYADTLGGYPTGYMIAAAERDVTKNAQGKMSEAASRGTVAIMIYNAINAPIMKQTKYSSNLSEWEFMDGTKSNPYESLLNTKLDGYKVEGIVLATSTSQMSSSSLKVGYVNYQVTNTFGVNAMDIGADTNYITKADNFVLRNTNANGTDADSLLFYMTTAYLQRNNYDELEIVCIVSKYGRNDEYFIDDASLIFDPAEDSSYAKSRPREEFSLASVNTSANNKYIYSYWQDSREDSRMTALTVSADANIIWNGQDQGTLSTLSNRATPFKSSDEWDANNVVRPLVGTVKLVDIDMDGEIDIIDSRNYDVAIVEEVDTANKVIDFKEVNGTLESRIYLSTDRNPDLKSVKIVYEGKEIDYTELQEFDVLNICTNGKKNTNATFYDIIVTRDVAEGSVRTINESNNSYEIDGWDEPLKASKGLSVDLELNLGDEGVFYLDMNGNIAYADTSGVLNGEFGYLYQVRDGDWDNSRARIFNKEGKDVAYNIDSKVKINGVNGVKMTSMETALTVEQINNIFGTGTTNSNAAADLVYGYSGSGAITAKILLEAIAGNTGYSLKPILSDLLAGDVTANRMINYTLNASNAITAITLPIKNGSASNKFTFVQGSNGATTWVERTNRFSGMKLLADSAVIFIIPTTSGKDISDFKVMSPSALQDETEVDQVYAYCNIQGQGPSIVLLTSDVVSLGGFGIFSGSSRGLDSDGQEVNRIAYYSNGVRATDLIAYDSDITVAGCGVSRISDKYNGMSLGDVFTYEVNSKGDVTSIQVLFRAGESAPEYFNAAIDVAIDNPTYDNWDIYNQNSSAGSLSKPVKVDNEVLFGLVSKVSTSSGMRNVTVVNETGVDGTGDVFLIPSTTPATIYNPAKSLSNKLTSGTVANIVASGCKKSDGNLIFDYDDNGKITESTLEQLTYVFLRLYKGDVEEVIYITYAI